MIYWSAILKSKKEENSLLENPVRRFTIKMLKLI